MVCDIINHVLNKIVTADTLQVMTLCVIMTQCVRPLENVVITIEFSEYSLGAKRNQPDY